jgi:hypothetical protein
MKNNLLSMLAGTVLAFEGLESRANTNLFYGPITNNVVLVPIEVQEYLVTANSSGNGNLIGSTNNWVEAGSNATVTANPTQFYQLDQWSDGNTNAVRNLMVTNPINLTANFKKQMDANGVAEDWKANYGVTNSLEDIDGDGVSNMNEYFSDTNPTNANSYFSTKLYPNNLEIPNSSLNCKYYLDSAGNLAGPWSEKTNAFGNGNSLNFSTIGETNNPVFYRGRTNRINP